MFKESAARGLRRPRCDQPGECAVRLTENAPGPAPVAADEPRAALADTDTAGSDEPTLREEGTG